MMSNISFSVNLLRVLKLAALFLLLSACSGGSESGFGETLVQNREALKCVRFDPGTVTNLCDFAIVVRTFGGTSTAVTIPANSTVDDPDANVISSFGACEAPLTSVPDTKNNFQCL